MLFLLGYKPGGGVGVHALGCVVSELVRGCGSVDQNERMRDQYESMFALECEAACTVSVLNKIQNQRNNLLDQCLFMSG